MNFDPFVSKISTFFSGNLYNKKLRVDFVKFIRKEKKFKGIDQLRKQIKLDLKVAKQTY